jgi:hypothetical protein
MSEAAQAAASPPAAKQSEPQAAQNPINELKVSGHLMTLDAGLFCVVQTGAGSASDSGLPGVRVSLPPGPAGRPDAVSIRTFRDDGFLTGGEAAALIRVAEGPAQVLVTIYQSREALPEQAPRIQVMRLGDAQGAVANGMARSVAPPADAEIFAHVQRTGDVAGRLGDWIGARQSRLWVEGFAVSPKETIAPEDIEYQAVLGRGWLSPWVEGGKYCGSRGMALPLLGLKVRLKGNAASTHEVSCHATFVDGSKTGPVPGGESCEAESLAALEAFQVTLRPKSVRPKPAEPPAPVRQSATSGRKTAGARTR